MPMDRAVVPSSLQSREAFPVDVSTLITESENIASRVLRHRSTRCAAASNSITGMKYNKCAPLPESE